MIASDPVFMDPVYVAVDLGVLKPKEDISTDLASTSRLVLERSPTAKKNADEIKQQAYNILQGYFSHENTTLGQEIDISSIGAQLLSLNGVQRVYMTRSDAPTLNITGLSLLLWNPVYPEDDIEIVNQNISLPYYKYPYAFDEASLLDKIEVTQARS
jgi:hypothetical protein